MAQALTLGVTPVNRLYQASQPLLLILSWLSSIQDVANITLLQRKLLAELDLFTQQAKTAGVADPLVQQAHYLLCTLLDEAILQTSWGIRQQWGSRSLLSHYYQESWGGEKFFTYLEEATTKPEEQAELLLLAYQGLSLGFQGKYRLQPNGNEHLYIIKQQLADMLKPYLNSDDSTLFDWQPTAAANPKTKANFWRRLLTIGMILGCFFSFLKLNLVITEHQLIHDFQHKVSP